MRNCLVCCKTVAGYLKDINIESNYVINLQVYAMYCALVCIITILEDPLAHTHDLKKIVVDAMPDFVKIEKIKDDIRQRIQKPLSIDISDKDLECLEDIVITINELLDIIIKELEDAGLDKEELLEMFLVAAESDSDNDSTIYYSDSDGEGNYDGPAYPYINNDEINKNNVEKSEKPKEPEKSEKPAETKINKSNSLQTITNGKFIMYKRYVKKNIILVE